MSDEDGDAFDELDDEPFEGDDPSRAESVDSLFAESEIDPFDADRLWDELEEPFPSTPAPDPSEPRSGETVVPKDRYCESCQFLSDPPDVSCTHEGTTIVEFVDREHVRVRNCPVVARRQGPGSVRRE